MTTKTKTNAERLLEMMENDPQLARKVKAANPLTFLEITKSLSVPCSENDVRDAIIARTATAALTDEQLESVVGGMAAPCPACGAGTTTKSSICTNVNTDTDPCECTHGEMAY